MREALSIKNYALRLVSIRPRSAKELALRLRQKGFLKDDIRNLVEEFQSKGILDDERFTAAWIDSRSAHNQKGERLLRLELLGKGVDEKTISKVIEEKKETGFDESSQARELIQKKMKGLSRLDGDTLKRRLYDLLKRRGFKTDTIYEVVKESCGEIEHQDI